MKTWERRKCIYLILKNIWIYVTIKHKVVVNFWEEQLQQNKIKKKLAFKYTIGNLCNIPETKQKQRKEWVSEVECEWKTED